MTQDDVRNAIVKAFASVPKPASESVVVHECVDCLHLKDQFEPYTWDKVPPENVDGQSTHLAQFTPAAFHYYLPTYLLRSVQDPMGDVCIFTAYRLNDLESAWGQERYSRLSPDQVRSVALALRYVQSVAPDEEIAEIIPKWEELASSR